jgi:glycopeptide antibiotics resistance protein
MVHPFSKRHRFFKYRVALLIGMIILIPVGYTVRFSQITGLGWFVDMFGSIAYEIFWIFLVAFLYPKASPLWTAIGVCLATCMIEFLQLVQTPFLQALRATLPGRLVLGNTFLWSDFISYFLGSFLGWVSMRRLNIFYFK